MSTWDIAISYSQMGQGRLALPTNLSAALREKGYNRVRVELTDDGILLVPYTGERPKGNTPKPELPEWSA